MRQDGGARRLIALVDEGYERGVPLCLEARYRDGHLAFPLRRPLGRLREMEPARFWRD